MAKAKPFVLAVWHAYDVCLSSLLATCVTQQGVACRNARIAEMEGQVAPRPMSRERLPVMEGFKEGLAPEMSAQSEVMSM